MCEHADCRCGLLDVPGSSSDARDLPAREAGDIAAAEAVAPFYGQAEMRSNAFLILVKGARRDECHASNHGKECPETFRPRCRRGAGAGNAAVDMRGVRCARGRFGRVEWSLLRKPLRLNRCSPDGCGTACGWLRGTSPACFLAFAQPLATIRRTEVHLGSTSSDFLLRPNGANSALSRSRVAQRRATAVAWSRSAAKAAIGTGSSSTRGEA